MRIFVLKKQDLEGLTQEVGEVREAAQEKVRQEMAGKLNSTKDEISNQLSALQIDPNDFSGTKETLQEIINELVNLVGAIEATEEQTQQPLRKQGTISFVADSDKVLLNDFISVVATIIKNYPPIDKDTADTAQRAINEMREILNQMEKEIIVVAMPPEE